MTITPQTVLMSDDTSLKFLGDWLFVPPWVPLSNAFSLGDLMLMIGIIWLIQDGMRKSMFPPVAGKKQEQA